MVVRMCNYFNKIVQHDLKSIVYETNDWSRLNNKSVLITGATGMLARYFAYTLIYLNEHHNLNITIFLLARDQRKLDKEYGALKVKFLVQDVCEKIEVEGDVDYIFHAAGNASPYFIEKDPVSIIEANVIGTLNVLNLAKQKTTKKVLFTSTREVYGKVEDREYITEDDFGTFSPLESRSCYPESKRMSETILKSYQVQFGIDFNVLRIAHTYGPGMIFNDGRVIADLIGDGAAGKDMLLKSDGTAVRAFCYISDAVTGIFNILFKGENGLAYNIANEDEEISIHKLANKITDIAHSGGSVTCSEAINNDAIYCSYTRVKLDTTKLRSLEWQPKVNLNTGIKCTLDYVYGIKSGE